ncbi:cyclin-D3-2-like [Punica granatum]|uniref:Uncharacterized protein n=2 Tax=Punica granatum TaxID=22663 RepID=A0A218XBI0_PUNGR|nr:cyclin-D3-2-like [Punica granatum]OWM82148.1 hypothetical protein CDL15_Pgr001722 [Punica granatum]PKI31913.1 hypothetical protein CRG98_047695 [Punica granatum]
MALQQEEQTHHHLQPPPLFLNDLLFCEEEQQQVDEVEEEDNAFVYGGEDEDDEEESEKGPPFPWEEDGEDLLDSLISKQAETHPCYDDLISDGPLMAVRKQAVEWILRVHSHYEFSALTAVVAVNYFDRFLLSFRFQRDNPWLGQLIAVACLSLAAKLEETHVPVQLLLHLQVEESVYLFEPKTIQRMELLVLSTLNWRMNPITPLAFFDHIIRKLPFRLEAALNWEFFWRFERLILSVLTDVRLLHYLPSTLASAAMRCIVKEAEPFESEAFQDLLTSFLKINKDKVDQCYELLAESLGSRFCSLKNGHKRRKLSIPSSPSGVIDASFSCESSNDSWAVASSVSSSPEPSFKRSRTLDHHQQPGLPLPSLRSFLQGCSQ